MSSEIFQQTRAIKDLTQAVKGLKKAVENHPGMTVVNNSPVENYHDGDTMSRVYSALMTEGMTREDAVRTVSTLQNAGILFRERR